MNFVQQFIAWFPYFKAFFIRIRQSLSLFIGTAGCQRLLTVVAQLNAACIYRNKFYQIFRAIRNTFSTAVAKLVYERCSIFYKNRLLGADFCAVTKPDARKPAVVQWAIDWIYYCTGDTFFYGKFRLFLKTFVAVAQDNRPLRNRKLLLRLVKFLEFMLSFWNKHLIFDICLFF